MTGETWGALIVLLCTLMVAGAVVGTTWAAATNKLARNPLAGIRTRSTMRSDTAWVAGHRAALPLSRTAAASVAACTLAAVLAIAVGHPLVSIGLSLAGILAALLFAIPITRRADAGAQSSADHGRG
ncbi:MAG: SdpI family protein [Actinobacteria bacterium]|jgi:hypothetical protein|nr:SdpI family protein [Actinomycetota bacterium]